MRVLKLTTFVVGVAYFPLVYYAVYVPFLVPRLSHWNSIPAPIVLAVTLPYAVAVGVFGATARWSGALLGALVIAAGNTLTSNLAAYGGGPGFHDAPGGLVNGVLFPMVVIGVPTIGLAVLGRAARGWWSGRSQAT